MIRLIRQRFFTIKYKYETELEQRRAVALNIINSVLLLFSVVWVVLGTVFGTILSNQPAIASLVTPASFIVPALTLVIYWLLQNGYLRFAILGFIGVLFSAPLAVAPVGLSANTVMFILLPMIAASGLLERRRLLIVFVLVLAFVMLGALVQSQQVNPQTQIRADRVLIDVVLVTTSMTMILAFLYVFNGQTQDIANNSERNITGYRKMSRFASELDPSTIETEMEVMSRALRFIINELGYGYAQMYIANSEGQLVQRLNVGLNTETLSESDKNFGLGDVNLLVIAARRRETIFISIMEDFRNRRMHFMPSTRYGLAIPVMEGEALIGVLDVQSDFDQPFDDNARNVLEAVGVLIANAIHQVRVNNTLRDNLAKQEQINRLARGGSNINRARTDAMQYWDNYLQKRGESVVGFDAVGINLENAEIIEAKHLNDTLRQALVSGQVHIVEEADKQILNVPILIGQEVLGAMTFDLPRDIMLTERQFTTANIIARRLAVALENRRLIEQSQSQVERERKANQIVNELIAATDVQTVLRRAVDNFNQALGAINTGIHIEPSALEQLSATDEQPVGTQGKEG